MARTRASVTAGTTENNIFFYSAGGHSHDGQNSSLIDATKYSVYDFNFGYISDNPVRRQFQINSFESLKQVIRDTVTDSILSPAGIVLQPNTLNGATIIARTIEAGQIVANTITADELVSNIVLVNNTIRSSNYSSGSTGWLISNTGSAEFNNVTVRGTVVSNSGTIGGWSIGPTSITGGSTSLYSNGYIYVNVAKVGPLTLSSSGFNTFTASTNDAIELTTTGRLYARSLEGSNRFISYLHGHLLQSRQTDATYTPSFLGAGAFIGFYNASTGISPYMVVNNSTAGGLFTADKYVWADGTNGYVHAKGYIESIAGNEGNNSSPPRVWGSNGDGYMRTYLTSALSVNYATSSGTASSANSVTWGNVSGKPTNFVFSGDINVNIGISTSNGISGGSLSTTGGGNINADGEFYRANAGAIAQRSGAAAWWGNSTTGGFLGKASSSSIRYKENIGAIPEILNPMKFLDVDIVKFKYRDGVLAEEDNWNNQELIGFIAEDINEKYPLAVTIDEEGRPDSWNYNVVIPAMMYLIKDLYKKIEILESK